MPQKTVLVVEDDPSTREIFAVVLRHRGHRVITAPDGRDGIRIAREERPEAVVLDIRMPRADGWTVTEVLKRDRRTRNAVIVVASVHDISAHEAHALWDAFIQKPCDPAHVADTVERILREREREAMEGPTDADPAEED